VDKKLPKVLTIAEMEKLFQLSEQDLDATERAMIELLYAVGLRVSELVNLDVNNVNLDSGFLRCFGKGSKERMLPLANNTIDELAKYLKLRELLLKRNRISSPALFVTEKGNRITRQ